MLLLFRSRTALSGLCLVAAGCAGDATAPPTPSNIVANLVAASGTVGAALATAPQFAVHDGSGNPIGGVAVTIVVSGGGGTLTGAPTKTASSGFTSVGTWVLGTGAGANVLTVTVSGLPPLTITAQGLADVASKLAVTAGGAQLAAASAALPAPVTFRVTDKFDNGVPNIPVNFTISGGGSLSGQSQVISDANGFAVSPTWTLGKTTIAQQITASAAGFSSSSTATVASNFTLDVRFFGTAMDPTIQAAFTTAKARIQGLVTGALPSATLSALTIDLTPCGITGVTQAFETTTGVIVYATVGTLGPGILGSAGPCYTRINGGLSLIGVMTFSASALQGLANDGRLNDVILHEMLHTLGFGTLWANKFLVSGVGTSAPLFTGPFSAGGCQFHGGGTNCSTTVPLETTGGAGTRDVHWRENTTGTGIGFKTELMTGYVSSAGIPNPVSKMTIGSMADLGYVVNYLPYDAYDVPGSLAGSLAQIRESQGLGEYYLKEILREPIGAVDAVGRVHPMPERK